MITDMKYEKGVLPFRVRISTSNPVLAEMRVGEYADIRLDRGYRIRCIRNEDGSIELGAYDSGMVRAAIRCLEDSGYKPKVLPWKRNKLLV